MKSILVIGATGKQGNAVVRQLLTDGWHVRALTRNKHNDKLTSIESDQLEIFEGDLSNQQSLEEEWKNNMDYIVFNQSLKMILRKN